MRFGQKLVYTALGALLVCTWQLAPDFADEVSAASHEGKMQYLVMGSGGPGPGSPAETVQLLEGMIIPTFDYLAKLKAENKLLGGGLPVGGRAVVFILEASSNAEADQIVRDVPAWPVLQWEVTPLQAFEERAAKERAVVQELKEASK